MLFIVPARSVIYTLHIYTIDTFTLISIYMPIYLTYIYFTWDMEMLVVRNQMQQPQISASSLNLLILFLNFCLHLTKNYNYNYVFWELGQESNAATTNIFASSLT